MPNRKELNFVGGVKGTIRRLVPRLIGCGMVLAASCTFAQNPNGPLSQLLDTYNQATNGWIDQFQNYAMNLFVALAGIEFAWTAVILLLEQRDLEGWVAAFIKKLMGVSFFYALLLYGPRNWIPAIINSFTQIGQSVGGISALTPESILQAGTTMAGQILQAAVSINIVAAATVNITWVLLLDVMAIVIVICYIAITFQFIMAQVEGYIVVSTGMLCLGFGGSRWTSSYVERFLGAAVSTGIRIMVIFLIVGLGQQLTRSTWSPAVAAILPQMRVGNFLGAAESAFLLVAGIVVFTALALRLPKVVGAVISGSPSLSGGDLAGGMGSILGGAAAVAGIVAAPEALAAKLAGGGTGAARDAMSAVKAADFISAPSPSSTMGSASKDISPPSSQGMSSRQMASPPSLSSANSLGGSSSTVSSVPSPSGSIAEPTVQPSPPSSSSSNGAGGGPDAGTSAAMNGSPSPGAPPPVAESSASPSPTSAPVQSASLDSASGDGPGQSEGNGASGAQKFFAAARSVSDGLRQAQGAFASMENDGGGAPPSPPTPTVGRD